MPLLKLGLQRHGLLSLPVFIILNITLVLFTLVWTHTANASNIYLVRHFEKQTLAPSNPHYKDPNLTMRGVERAAKLAVLMQAQNIKTIISSPYQRALQTAMPTSEQVHVDIDIWPAKPDDALVSYLLSLNSNTLIVGHSNTIPPLISSLGGPKVVIEEQQYGDLFVLRIGANKSIEFEQLTVE